MTSINRRDFVASSCAALGWLAAGEGRSLAHSQAAGPVAGPRAFSVTLRRRRPSDGAADESQLDLDPSRVGIVVVDMWNFHWCKTSSARVASLVPRMVRVLQGARQMGMSIFWCPSDVADNYVGTPQHERALNAPLFPLPPLEEIQCPPAADGGGCTCGPMRCRVNYGWDGMHPDLVMGDDEAMPNDFETLYSLCRARGLSHLIYMGVHTQICLLGKSIGLHNMLRAGMSCILARDLTDAHGRYDPEHGVFPDRFTAGVVEHFEKYLAPSINFAEELRKAGLWDEAWIVDPVRITPWGLAYRPHLFEGEQTVTLSAPWQPNADIFYTLDGTDPTPRAFRFQKPFRVAENVRVRARAFEGRRQVCLPSESFFFKLPPMPPAPHAQLSDLRPLSAVGPSHSPSSNEHRFSPGARPPQRDHNNRLGPLRLRGETYARGMGVQAPDQLRYEIKPEYDRFVALAGIDEGLLEVNNGSNLARYPSVIFKIYIDGRLAGASPIIRISEPPWRFDVKIPPGSRRITLNAIPAGNGNREDMADWVQAGFTVRGV